MSLIPPFRITMLYGDETKDKEESHRNQEILSLLSGLSQSEFESFG